MNLTPVHRERCIEWAAASCSSPGENISGDAHLVVPTPVGVLACAIDGLGHGTEARKAARTAT